MQKFLPFLFIYQICASGLFAITLFSVGVFLGISIFDLWKFPGHIKIQRFFIIVFSVFLPELVVLLWVIIIKQKSKSVLRILAGITCSLYMMFEFGISLIYGGLNNSLIMHLILLPIIFVTGTISFIIAKYLSKRA